MYFGQILPRFSAYLLAVLFASTLFFLTLGANPVLAVVDYSNANSPQSVLKDNWGTVFFPCSPSGKLSGDQSVSTPFLEGNGVNSNSNTVCLVDDSSPAQIGDSITKASERSYFVPGDRPEPYNTIDRFNGVVGIITGENTTSARCNANSAIGNGASSFKCYNLDRVNGLAMNIFNDYQATQGGQGGRERQTCLSTPGRTPTNGSLCLKDNSLSEIINGITYHKDPTGLEPNGLCIDNSLRCFKPGAPVTGTPVPTVAYTPTNPTEGSCNVTETNGAGQISTPVSGGSCVTTDANRPTGCYVPDTTHQIAGCGTGQMCCSTNALTQLTDQEEDPNAGMPWAACRGLKLVNLSNLSTIEGLTPGTVDEDATWLERWQANISLANIVKKMTGKLTSFVRKINGKAEQVGEIIVKNAVGDNLLPLDSIDRTVSTGADSKIYEYFLGCEQGNICAASRDLKVYTGLDIQGDDVCVPNQQFPKYVSAKITEYQARKNGGGGEKTLVAAAAATPADLVSDSLASLCFKQIPYAESLGRVFYGSHILNFTRFGQRVKDHISPGLVLDDFKKLGGIYGLLGAMEERRLGPFGIIQTGPAIVLEQFKGKTVTPWLAGQCPDPNIDVCKNLSNWVGSPDPNKTPADALLSINTQEFVDWGDVPVNKADNLKTNLSRCLKCAYNNEISTAIGCLPVDNFGAFITKTVFTILLSIAGAYALMRIIAGAIMMQASQGDSTKIQKAQKMITQALIGLLVVIFSLLILRIVGVNILRIPGFN